MMTKQLRSRIIAAVDTLRRARLLSQKLVAPNAIAARSSTACHVHVSSW